jgi:hypothetical protein
MVLTGVVDEQLRVGCLSLGGHELVADSALWYSVLTAGEPVTVTGYVDNARASQCGQPKVLVVTEIRR